MSRDSLTLPALSPNPVASRFSFALLSVKSYVTRNLCSPLRSVSSQDSTPCADEESKERSCLRCRY